MGQATPNHELAWKLLFSVAEIHLSRSFKPSEILVPLDASSKPGASSVVGARRPCPYFENTLQKRMEMMHVTTLKRCAHRLTLKP